MNLNFIIQWAPLFLKGLMMTVSLWLGAVFIAIVIGFICGILRCRRLRLLFFSPLLDFVTFIFRGVPFYLQLLIVYFVLPDFSGINLSPFHAGIIALGLCSAAYVSQILRGAIDAISDEQWEASLVLGLNTIQTLRYIIIPQALRISMPMLTGECDQILKSTSIISTIGVFELTKAGMNIIASDMQVLPAYLAIAFLYLSISTLLNALSALCERRFNYVVR